MDKKITDQDLLAIKLKNQIDAKKRMLQAKYAEIAQNSADNKYLLPVEAKYRALSDHDANIKSRQLAALQTIKDSINLTAEDADYDLQQIADAEDEINNLTDDEK